MMKIHRNILFLNNVTVKLQVQIEWILRKTNKIFKFKDLLPFETSIYLTNSVFVTYRYISYIPFNILV